MSNVARLDVVNNFLTNMWNDILQFGTHGIMILEEYGEMEGSYAMVIVAIETMEYGCRKKIGYIVITKADIGLEYQHQ